MLCYSTGSTVMVSKEENEILAGQKWAKFYLST
jgi:hypothetical protein